MIDRIIAVCFGKRLVAWTVAVILAIYGYLTWIRMPVEAYPDVSDVTVQVTTQVPGLASEEVEQEITVPLERALAGTPKLATIRSSSTFGLSLITMVFHDGAEDYWVRQRVAERTGQVNLPPGITPSQDSVTSPIGEIYRYTLESGTKNLMELSEIQRWIMIPALQQVPGVVEVDNFGGFTKEFQLIVDPASLQRYGVQIADVITAINANNANAGGGRVARGEQGYVIRGIGMIRTLDDMGRVVVTQHNGLPVTVRDLGTLQFGHQERQGILGKDNNPDTIQGNIHMLKYENPSEILKGVHAKIAELGKQLAPMGVKIVPYNDRDILVRSTVDKVSHTVMEGIGLVCIVLILFLGSPRSALVASITIPIALVVVFILMSLTKMPANLFSLGAIDFGIIVDGAIVMLEAIVSRRESKPDQPLTVDDALDPAGHVAKSIFFASLIIVTAYLPLFAFEHAEAKLFTPMAFTVGFAIFGALICTITLIPGLAYVALRKPRKLFHNKPLEWLQHRYKATLTILLENPVIVYLTTAVAFVAVIVLGATAGREFLPDLDEGALWMQVHLPSGISVDKAMEMSRDMRKALLEFPEISYAITQLGRSDDGTDPWTPSHIEAPVGLKPYDQWPKGETRAMFLKRLQDRLDKIPGMSVGISQPMKDNIDDAVGGAHSGLVMRLYGQDLAEMRGICDRICDVLHSTRGTASASIFQDSPIPQISVEVDRDAAARYGINVADVATVIQSGMGGAPVTQIYNADRVYNATVRLPFSTKSNPERLGHLQLKSTDGAMIPLSQLTRIRLINGESVISHEMTRRQLTIALDVRDRDMTSYLDEAQDRIAKEVKFDHAKYRTEWAGQFENQRRAESSLIIIFGVVIGLMGILLFAAFGKIRQVGLVLGIVPLATLGGLVALHCRDATLNVASAVGFIALFGVAIQNGIIMIANINRLRLDGSKLEDCVVHGAGERFRPVLMTATVASIGMLPAAMATGVGTDVQRGIATVVVGGLIVATMLTIFILPVFYFVIERFVERRFARRAAAVAGKLATGHAQ